MMTPSATRIQRRELRAPQEDRGMLVDPSFADVGVTVAANLEMRVQRRYLLQSRSLDQVTRLARRELLRDALRWTAAYRDVDSAGVCRIGPIFLAGHQPQLFHPGVWFKNFALGYLARQHGATAVNLQIDSDTLKSTAMRVPGGTLEAPLATSIPMDLSGRPIPYEERRILDRPTFVEFGRRAAEALVDWIPDPLVRRYWPMVVKRSQYTDNLGACLAQARHQLERQWGLDTLEVPQSWVCQSESFAWLAVHLLAHHARFRETYNQAVKEYRQVHGIRNSAHPVPELATDGEWLESPFWVWSADDPVRRPLFVRSVGSVIRLSDRCGWETDLPLNAESDGLKAVDRWMQLPAAGIKIRSRALITTLWARLVLGDLFLHGIGGAKYDEVTDVLIERFFGLKAPGFMVASATLLLPGARQLNGDDPRAIAQQLRDLTWHPERAIDGQLATGISSPSPGSLNPSLANLLREKQHWIQQAKNPENARQRHQAICRINEALQPWVSDHRRSLEQRQEEIRQVAQADAVRSWREYGFPFHSAELLPPFLFGLLPGGE